MTHHNAVRIIRRFVIVSLDNDIPKRRITPTVLRRVIIQNNYISLIVPSALGHIKQLHQSHRAQCIRSHQTRHLLSSYHIQRYMKAAVAKRLLTN